MVELIKCKCGKRFPVNKWTIWNVQKKVKAEDG